MTIAEVIPIIESLPHADKFKLMQLLLSQLAQEEGIQLQTDKKQEIPQKMDNISKTEKTNSKDNPFCGMWKDRADMQNVDAYVRTLRQGRQF